MKRRLTYLVLLLGLFGNAGIMAEPFSAELMVRLDRVGAPVLSPDGSKVVYAVRKTDMEADKGRYDLWWTGVTDGLTRRLTAHLENDTAPAWSADGLSVYFLSGRGGSSQVWRIALDGGMATQVTHFPLDVGSFRLSQDGKKLVTSMEVYLDCEGLACTQDRDAAAKTSQVSGVVYDKLFMRHWDHWLNAKHSQLFVVDLDGKQSVEGEPMLLARGITADIPSRVWGGIEEYAVSRDGSTVYFAARIRDRNEPISTNFDIYSAPTNGDGPVANLTKANQAWDTQPVLSPDGQSLAYLAMSRPGFEADQFQIFIRDLSSGKTRALAGDWDHSASSLSFSPDGKSLLVSANDVGNKTLWRINTDDGQREKLVDQGTVTSFSEGPHGLVFAKDDLKTPTEIYVLAGDQSEARQLTHFTEHQMKDIEMGSYQQFSFEGAGNETVYGYVMKPAGYKEGEKYPIAFIIHGGPQGSFGNHFHYRWNPQTYAGQGFAAVFIDFHGSTGYGQDFTDSISGDWGGAPLVDLKLGLRAALEQYDFLDGDKTCALGASYGGYMINWIAGNWPERFDCLVNHDGLFDMRSMYYTTEELWFVEWENDGPYYEKPENHEKFNPVDHVTKWQTPMLVIHGELDYRVPVTQGIATFTALQRREIPSKFLYFPDENHWVLKPNNSVMWHHEVNQWLHQYLD